jgi:RHS repeat-associated protein
MHAFRQRFSKANNGSIPTIFSYGQDGTLLEENANGFLTDYIYANARPVATLDPASGKVSFLHTDHLGTPQLATYSARSPVWGTTYQPFGTTGLINGSITQNVRLPGQCADVETGFNHNGFRDYMPNVGRYLESDPIGLAGGLFSSA